MKNYSSWGRYPSAQHKVFVPQWIHGVDFQRFFASCDSILPYGCGRSYGDSCLNDGGAIVSTERFDNILSFDRTTGLVECEAGVTLSELLDLIVPAGWFLPVTPGTRFVTLGGAIANDIHGKNHHCAGTFGCHVRSFELLRSDGIRYLCSSESNPDYFAATIGGLGLTGLLTRVTLQLKKIGGPGIRMDSIQCRNLEEFLSWSSKSEKEFEYTVSWIDCLAKGRNLGRGIFMRGNHLEGEGRELKKPRPLMVPIELPSWTLNRWTVAAFNFLYFHKQRSSIVSSTTHYEPFFYPLDAVEGWNKIYGRRGFLQFQCVVPSRAAGAIEKVLETVSASGSASFLAVLKEFGSITSPGLMSFPRPGITVCFDFPFSKNALKLFRRLEEIVLEADGAMYPAKDATMSGEAFQRFYPKWKEFSNFIDPKFSSSFWRRVTCSK